MFAYIKWLEGSCNGQQIIVHTSTFKQKITLNYNPKAKYSVQDGNAYRKAQILYLASSKEEIEKWKTNEDSKRLKKIPASQLETASENEANISKSKTFTSLNVKKEPKEKLKKFASLLHIPVDTLNNYVNNDEVAIENKLQKGAVVSTKKPKIISSTNVHPIDVCKRRMNDLEKENDDLQNKVKTLNKEVKRLKKEKGELRENFKKERNEKKEYQALNQRLQSTLMERLNEEKTIQKQIEAAKNDVQMDHRSNFVLVGEERSSDNTVHIGRGHWIDKNIYSAIINKSKTPSGCVGNIIIRLFDEAVLLKSTVTGKISNKSIKSKSNNENVEQLDQTILLICKDFYFHWLDSVYKSQFPNYPEVMEKGKFFEYVAKKISYLKRPPQSTKTANGPKTKKAKTTMEPHEENHKYEENNHEAIPTDTEIDDHSTINVVPEEEMDTELFATENCMPEQALEDDTDEDNLSLISLETE